MRPVNPFRLLISALCLAAAVGRSQEARTFPGDSEGRSRVELTAVFQPVPPSGFAPLRVRVVNDGDGERRFTVNTVGYGEGRDNQVRAGFAVAAGPRQSTTAELMAPVFPCAGSSVGQLSVETTTATGRHSWTVSGGGLELMPFVAFSRSLVGRNLSDINDAARPASSHSWRSRDASFACSFEATHLPSDWRGYTGIDVLALRAEEWQALQPGQVSAVRQWVMLGGVLEVHGAANAAALGLPVDVSGGAVTEASCGMGRVTTVDRAPGDLVKPGVHDRYELTRLTGRPAAPAVARRSVLGDGLAVRSLDEVIGARDFSAWQVGLILLIFGVLVGPVNLFKWAGPGRRHRLFITTPLISLGASLVLLIYILLKDGIGGEGWRAAVVFIDGTEHMAHVRQVQMSRTGVLLGSSFTTAEPVAVNLAEVSGSALSPLEIASTNAYGIGFSRQDGFRCSLEDGRSHGGEWFRSRSEQAQVVEAVTATRGDVEIAAAADGVPAAVSRFEFPLRGLYCRDRSGQWWRAPGELPTGTPVTLVRSTPEESMIAVRQWVRPAGWSGFEPSAVAAGRPCYVALADDARAGLVDTLDSVRWKEQRVILFGNIP